MNRLSLKNDRLKFKTIGKLPIILEECIEYTPIVMKENRRMSTCNRLDLITLGSQPVMPKNLPDHWTKYHKPYRPTKGLHKTFKWSSTLGHRHSTVSFCNCHELDIVNCHLLVVSAETVNHQGLSGSTSYVHDLQKNVHIEVAFMPTIATAFL